MHHRHLALLALLIVGLVGSLMALEIDEQELEAVEGADIEFENYVGPVDRIDSREAIRGIGRALGREVRRTSEADYDGRYTARRIIGDPSEPLRAADIISLEPDARVDHIDNLRRIVAGYLEEAWDYRAADADLLARFATIYNAVHRGAIDFFAERYRSAVVAILDPARAGLSTSYRDWAGATQMLLPVQPDREPGALDAIDPGQLVDELVILELRRRSDLGIADRKAIIEFIERVIEERTEAIAEEREAIEAEREQIEERRREIDEEIARIDDETEPAPPAQDEPEPEAAQPEPPDVAPQDDTPPADEVEPAPQPQTDPPDPEQAAQDEPVAEERPQLEEEREALAQREEELDEREQQLEEEEEQVAELTERVEELYEETAEDQQQLEEAAGLQRTVPFLRLGTGGTLELALVDIDDGSIVGEQTVPLAGRSVASFQGALVAAHAASGRLLLLDRGSLDVLAESESRVVPGATIHVLDSVVLTPIEVDGSVYLGEFDAALVLTRRSSREIDPRTDIAHRDDGIAVQQPNGNVIVLSLEDDLR